MGRETKLAEYMIVDNDTGRQFPLTARFNLIGCSTECDINISGLDKSEFTSGKHANIWRKESGTYWIRDEHSSNRTIVNGDELKGGKRKQLEDGMEIQFGYEGPTLTFERYAA